MNKIRAYDKYEDFKNTAVNKIRRFNLLRLLNEDSEYVDIIKKDAILKEINEITYDLSLINTELRLLYPSMIPVLDIMLKISKKLQDAEEIDNE